MEILIVVSVLGILFLITLPQFSKIKENQILKNALEDVVSTLHNAQSQSLASVNSSEYGVHFQSDRIIVFKGKIFSSGATDNKTINIISPASISNVTLGGVSSNTGDVYFERLSGVPNKTGTITITTPSTSKIVTISATGAVSVN
ncbi:MAG: type II secretion system protein [Candidatus Nomurabacteria bacterium]|nr:type II secretion system protein [Candidatus Nomurabacteria bacterium]